MLLTLKVFSILNMEGRGDDKHFLLERSCVSGMLYVTIDQKLICHEKFMGQMKIEVIFNDTFPLLSEEKLQICNLKKEIDSNDDEDLQIAFVNEAAGDLSKDHNSPARILDSNIRRSERITRKRKAQNTENYPTKTLYSKREGSHKAELTEELDASVLLKKSLNVKVNKMSKRTKKQTKKCTNLKKDLGKAQKSLKEKKMSKYAIELSDDPLLANDLFCPHCRRNFTNRREYRRHYRIQTEGYACKDCGKKSKFWAHHLVHQKVSHNVDVPLSLPEDSEKETVDSSNHPLLCVITGSKDAKSFRCGICQIGIHPHSLQQHMLLHTNEKAYQCCVCGIHARSATQLTSHLKMHSCDGEKIVLAPKKKIELKLKEGRQPKEIKNISCAHCSKKFDNQQDYVNHHQVKMQIHTCEMCNESLRSKAQMIVHANIVHGKAASSSLRASLGRTDAKMHDMCCIEINDKNEQTYKCKVCNFIANDLNILNSHMMKHTKELAYKCCVCGIEESDPNSFANHLTMHNMNDNNIKLPDNKELDEHTTCPYCSLTFKNKLNCDSHYELKTQMIFCDKCPKYFKYKAHLLTHYNIVHNSEAPFACSDLSNEKQVNGILCTKETTGTGEDTFKCNICQMSFSLMRSLRRHVLHHTGEKIFKCCVCNFEHIYLKSFKTHQAKHSRVNQFQCKQCEIYFKDRTELSKHQMVHKLKCELCSEEFENIPSRNYHVKVVHKDDDRLIKCDQCDRIYTSKKSYLEHKRFHRYRKPVQCPVCGLFVSHLKSHMQRHSNSSADFVCDKCPMKFRHKQSFKRHMLSHSHNVNTSSMHNHTYSCPKCPKKFSASTKLSRHLKIHLGDKPYVCEICGKACNRSSNLQIHMRVHNKKPRLMHCNICGCDFTRQMDLKDHIDLEHKKDTCALTSSSYEHVQHFQSDTGTNVSYQMLF